MEALPAYAEFPVICCGIDWLTLTSKLRGVSNALEDFGKRVMEQENAPAGQITGARRLGYVGHKRGSAFLGRRPDGVMFQLSGPRCTPLAQEAIRLSSNVSRIDVQVTVWTEGEEVDLSGWSYRQMISNRPAGPQAGALTLISNHPYGGTLGTNRRSSDAYARLYDKSVEARLGAPRTVWRYELELKGLRARRLAERLGECGAGPQLVSKLVYDFYKEKGLLPAFPAPSVQSAFGPSIATPGRDVLTWFRESLSKTVTKAIRQHGREVVLDALGLLNHN